MLTLLLACAPAVISLDDKGETGISDSAPLDSGSESGPDDTSVDSTDSTDSTDSGDSAETGDSGTGPVIEDLVLTLDPDIVTLVHASWIDPGSSSAWLEYRFETDAWLVAPLIGSGTAVVLGVPSETDLEVRAAGVVDGETIYSAPQHITTGPLPRDLITPDIVAYDPSIALDADYAMISFGGGDYTYSGPYWIEIFDRQGRVVWYKEIADSMFTFYPTVAREGNHIWYEAEDIFGVGSADPYVTRRTLDGRWSETWLVPGIGQAIAEGPDGSFYYELRGSRGSHGLNQLDADGNATELWDCSAYVGELGLRESDCYMNTCNWNEAHNSVLASMFEGNTVFEIDLDTNQPIRQMGQISEGEPYAFSPAESVFDYQHDVMWLDNGNLIASTHIRGRSGVQMAAEYSVDDATQTLTRVWYYQSTDRWATQLGEALRLSNGNTVQGYGQDGAVREVTTDGRIAWEAAWEKDSQGYRPMGHFSLIPDLYALNEGR